jgi:superfamily I DNA and RNA helicase
MLNESQYAANVEFISYTNLDNELFLLDETLDFLLSSSIKKEDITILSFLKYEDSIVKKSNHIIQEYRYDTSEITYSTIRKFKGLENKVIIITDLKHISDENLIYTAISRAKDLLYLFIHKDQYYKIKKEFSK